MRITIIYMYIHTVRMYIHICHVNTYVHMDQLFNKHIIVVMYSQRRLPVLFTLRSSTAITTH